MRVLFLIHLCAFLFSQVAMGSVRTATLKNDELLTVKTALGIATIIQAPKSIQSAIIGDQSAFKVEYLDQAVTVKPLRYGAKTNLYLFTESGRFNLRLVTLSQEIADYVVYIKEPGTATPTAWRSLTLSKAGKRATLFVTRISTTKGGFLLIEGRVSTTADFSIKPEQIWIKQGNVSKTIQHLYLSSKMSSKGRPVLIGVSVNKTDLQDKKSLTLELQGDENLSITISESALWK